VKNSLIPVITSAIIETNLKNGVVEIEFSEKVRFVRGKMKMSQEDLARALNVSFATINRWENDKTKPIKMAQAAFNDFCQKNDINFDKSEGGI